MTKYVKSIKFTSSGETYTIRDGEQKSRLDALEPQVAAKADTSTVNAELAGKQATLVSGENIKTINNQSILGPGNIEVGGGSGTSDYSALSNKPQINSVELSGNKTSADLGIITSDDIFGSDTQEVVGPGDRLFPEIDLTGTQSTGGGIGPYWYNDQTDIQNKDLYDFSMVFGRIDSELFSVRIGHVEGCAGTLTASNAANKLAPFETKTEELFAINAVGLETGVVYTFKLDGTDERVVNINQNYVGQNGYIHVPTDYVIGIGAKDSSKTHTDIQYKNTSVSGTPGFMYDLSNSGTLTQSYSYLNITFHIPTTAEETVYHFDEMIKPEDEIQSDIISGLVNDVEDLKAGASSLKGKYLSIIGDSISTYQGWNNVDPIPGAAVYYPHGSIDNVDKTYWKKLVDRTGMNLLVNNSWSGSAVCYYKTTGDVANTPARTILHKDNHNPDIILINMGTNDFYRLGLSSQAGAGKLTLGTWNGRGEQYPDKTLQSVNFRQAYAIMLRRVIEDYPRAEVYCCTVPCGEETGGGLNEFNPEGDSLVEFNDAIREIATAYGVKVIELATTGINYASRTDYLVDSAVHPNEAGMERFYEVIRASLESKLTTTTSAIRTSAYVKSNQGSENNGKVLGIDSTGAVVPVTAGGSALPDQTGQAGKFLTTDGTNASWASVGGGSVVTPAGEASVFDDSQPVNLFGTHTEKQVSGQGDLVFPDVDITGTQSAGAGKGPYWYCDQTTLQNKKLFDFSVAFSRIDSQPLSVRIAHIEGCAGTLTTSNSGILVSPATATDELFSIDATGLNIGEKYTFALDGTDSRVTLNPNYVGSDGYLFIPADYVVGAGTFDDTSKVHTDIQYKSGSSTPKWVFTSNGTSMAQSGCPLNYCFHICAEEDVTVQNFDSYLMADGEMHSDVMKEFFTSEKLFGETKEEIPLIVGEKVINSDETSNHGSTANATDTMGYFMTNNQSGIQNQKLYSCHIKFNGAGKMSVYLINLGGTGIITDISMLPGTNTLSSLTALATKAFEFNITPADISSDVQEILLDGTDPRVININQDLLEDGYIKVPTGYYIAFKHPTEDAAPNMCTFTYGGGDGATGSSFYYVNGISSSSPEGTRGKSPTTSPSSTAGILGVGWSICVNEGTQEIVTQNFDTYLATEETVTEYINAAPTPTNYASTRAYQGGLYFISNCSHWNGKLLKAVSYCPRSGITGVFKVGYPSTGTNDFSASGSHTGVTVSGIRTLFTIDPGEDGYTEIGGYSDKMFMLDGSDPRVTIVATDLYDSVNGGFLWNKTMLLGGDDRANAESSAADKEAGTYAMAWFCGTGPTSDYWCSHINMTNISGEEGNETASMNTHSSDSILIHMYTEKTEVQTTVHSDIIANALSDIEDLKEGKTDSPLKGKWISFLGDSITTWQGWSNIAPGSTSADVWYPKSQYGMTDVNQSYWKKLIDRTGANLLVNNSWSGSRVSYGGHSGAVVDTGTNDRCAQLNKTVDGVARTPDYIVINIGTNDFDNNVLIGTWNGRGERFPDSPDTLRPTTFREAYSVMLHRLRKNYPLAKIYCCTIPCGNVKSDGLNEINSEGISLSEYNDAIREVATAYGVRIVELATSGLDYYTLSNFYCDSNLHPNEAGMERYYELIRGALESNDSSNVSTPRLSKLMTGTASAVADATDTSDVVTQFNALLAVLRTRGVIAAS